MAEIADFALTSFSPHASLKAEKYDQEANENRSQFIQRKPSQLLAFKIVPITACLAVFL